jgi:integrase
MFSAAVSRTIITSNPASGITVNGEEPRRDRRAFTGEQLKIILNMAAETKFGGKRHTEVMWLLRLAMWTGCRINEAAQLRKCDVYRQNGVPVIHIKEGHPQQSVKNGESVRKVPLHPVVAEGFLAFAQASETDFIFGAFPYNRDNGRAAYLITRFGKFLRETCGINEPGLKQHAIRHRFHDAMDNAEIIEARQKTITGHARGDVHGKYGSKA